MPVHIVRAQNIISGPQTGLKSVPLTIRGQNGQVHRYKVEVAALPAQQEVGMMFRRTIPMGTGMLFPVSPAEPKAFWMRNTLIPLDIIFIAPEGRIERIAANAVPLTEVRIPSRGPVMAVLELAGGEAARAGLKVGDRVEWKR